MDVVLDHGVCDLLHDLGSRMAVGRMVLPWHARVVQAELAGLASDPERILHPHFWMVLDGQWNFSLYQNGHCCRI